MVVLTSDTEKFSLDGISSDTLDLFVDYLAPMPLAEQSKGILPLKLEQMKAERPQTKHIRIYAILSDFTHSWLKTITTLRLKPFVTGSLFLL